MDENLNNLNPEGQPASVPEDISSSSSAGQGYTVTPQGGYFSFDSASQQTQTPPETPPEAPSFD